MCRALLAVVKGTGSPVEQKLRIRCGAVCNLKASKAKSLCSINDVLGLLEGLHGETGLTGVNQF